MKKQELKPNYVSIDEFPTYKCRVPGCTEKCYVNSGIWAYLCGPHRYRIEKIRDLLMRQGQDRHHARKLANMTVMLAENKRAVEEIRRTIDLYSQ